MSDVQSSASIEWISASVFLLALKDWGILVPSPTGVIRKELVQQHTWAPKFQEAKTAAAACSDLSTLSMVCVAVVE